MNFLKQLSNRLAETKRSLVSLQAPQEIVDARRSICNSCESLFEPTMQCKKCGCFIRSKTLIARYSCPINKWTSAVREDKEN